LKTPVSGNTAALLPPPDINNLDEIDANESFLVELVYVISIYTHMICGIIRGFYFLLR